MAGELHQVLVDDVADMLEVGGEGQDLDVALAVLLAELGARGLDEVELDRLVEPVDRVVGGFDRLHRPGIVAARRRRWCRAACRPRGRPGSASRATRSPGPRPAKSSTSGSRWRGLPGSSTTGLSGSMRRHRLASGSVSGRKTTAAITLKAVWKLTVTRAGEGSMNDSQCTAGPMTASSATPVARPGDQVAERHPSRGHVGARLRHVGRQRAPDIGADDQGKREGRADDAARRKRHDQQHDRQAGMDEPGGQRGQDGSDHILVLHAFQVATKAGEVRSGSVASDSSLSESSIRPRPMATRPRWCGLSVSLDRKVMTPARS